MFILYRDNKEVARYDVFTMLYEYIHMRHSYSFAHACEHEGYSWAEVSDDAKQP